MAVYNGRVRLLGQGTVDREPTELATLAITNSAREIVEGDRLVADEAELKADFIPHSPDQTIDGQIIAVVNGIATVGQYQVVVINRGKAHGLEPGHVLISWQRSDVAVDRKGRGPGAQREFRSLITKHVQLPDERSGSMMIFKTYDKMSYALMMTSNTSARVNDPVRNP